MTTAFGALVRYRRRTLALTRDQLAHRMHARGQAVDIPALEDGYPAPHDPGFLPALAGALECRVGPLRVAHDLPAIDQDASCADKIVYLYAADEATMMQEELVDLQDLQQILGEWKVELANRAFNLRPAARADMDSPRFDA